VEIFHFHPLLAPCRWSLYDRAAHALKDIDHPQILYSNCFVYESTATIHMKDVLDVYFHIDVDAPFSEACTLV